eukprot:CAMPEP_0180639406 /NCGR_PEP_ID=MMETSP1037_2-20121125/44976_1 /TAXON_ID=632150 /ORGANISM="Azadinium spinosum, Strain 3D9" /LENGTH=355 /DNA_ID=CAMNT_0022661269 /DNA_START=116 /DNA_END=1184 /DNA_ORIENTATION=-
MALLAAVVSERETVSWQLSTTLDGRYRQSYRELPPAVGRATSEDWQSGLGDMSQVTRFRAFFLEEIGTRGLDATLQVYLPRLVLGQHKGLFHPMIRLCFALIAPSEGGEEAAEALAYSAARHEPLYRAALQDFGALLEPGAQADAGHVGDVAEVEEQVHAAWADLRQMYKSCGYNGQGHSFEVLAELYQDVRLHRICLSHLPVCTASVESCHLRMVQLALQLYKHQPGLTTLHAVTGGQAVSDLLPYLPPAAKVVSAKLYWIWLSTLFVEKGAPRVLRWDEASGRTASVAWPDVRQLALQPLARATDSAVGGLGDNEPQTHCIKMVYTCDLMWRKLAHPLYLEVAHSVALRGRPW